MPRFKLIEILKFEIMKITKYILFSIILSALLFTSCTKSYSPGKNIETVPGDTIKVPETEALLRFINNSGDYINSKDSPSLVSATNVFDNLGSYLIIDIRSKDAYVAGHINSAIHSRVPDLIDYLDKEVAASIYDKLVIVCKNGQSSAYVASVLRLIGYSNAYSLSYGMSSWNKSLDLWSSNLSSSYIGKLEQKTNPVEGMHEYPQLNTGERCGAEILQARGRTLLNTPFQKLKISADRVFKNNNDFYIINLWPKDHYDLGHIPGSYQYTPRKDINSETLLNTIPSDKKILVYGYTGQSSAFMTAYLRLLGYNVFTMPFGANSFMYNTLKNKGWYAFKRADKVNDFPLVKGANPSDESLKTKINSTQQREKDSKKPIIRRKKKEVEGGCS